VTRWAELILRVNEHGKPAFTLACAHGAARSEQIEREFGGGWAVRAVYDGLTDTFGSEMSERVKATVVMRSLLGLLLAEHFGCRCGFVPYAIEEVEERE
jgi:hypothetical protein